MYGLGYPFQQVLNPTATGMWCRHTHTTRTVANRLHAVPHPQQHRQDKRRKAGLHCVERHCKGATGPQVNTLYSTHATGQGMVSMHVLRACTGARPQALASELPHTRPHRPHANRTARTCKMQRPHDCDWRGGHGWAWRSLCDVASCDHPVLPVCQAHQTDCSEPSSAPQHDAYASRNITKLTKACGRWLAACTAD